VPAFLLLSGPPFGALMWDATALRLRGAGHPVTCLSGSELDPDDPERDLADRLRALGPDVVLFAHGTAIPTAVRAARQQQPALLVLCDGPLIAVDPITATLGRLAALGATALHPVWLQRYLASSLGLRRAVANPYAMDRDIVVALTDPCLAKNNDRDVAARWLSKRLAPPLADGGYDGRTLLLWGDSDRLYPASHADSALALLPAGKHLRVPGGRFMHPVERPWFLADEVLAYLANT
jgi:pimeloyl-ACP methyl ester carboxylesterase